MYKHRGKKTRDPQEGARPDSASTSGHSSQASNPPTHDVLSSIPSPVPTVNAHIEGKSSALNSYETVKTQKDAPESNSLASLSKEPNFSSQNLPATQSVTVERSKKGNNQFNEATEPKENKERQIPQQKSKDVEPPSPIDLTLDGDKKKSEELVKPQPPPSPAIPHPPDPPTQKESTSEEKNKPSRAIKDDQGSKKIKINPEELLNQKRFLKATDRKAEYNPVTLARKELFEDDYEKIKDSPPEHLPLHIVKNNILSQDISADLVSLNFNGIDQVTDCLFYVIHGGGRAPAKEFVNLKKLHMNGCINISDNCLKMVADLFPNLMMFEGHACKNITEKGLHYLFSKLNMLQNVGVMSTSVSVIPSAIVETKLLKGAIYWAGCPIISRNKAYYELRGESDDNYIDPQKHKLVILRDPSVHGEVIPLIMGQASTNQNPIFQYQESLKVEGAGTTEPKSFLNIMETIANNPLQDKLLSEGSIVMLTYSVSNKDLEQEAYRITDIMCSVLTKCQDVVFLLAEISEDGTKTNMQELIQYRVQFLITSLSHATYKLYGRTWHFECLDFKGQQGFACGARTLGALESLYPKNGETPRMLYLSVTKSNFQKEVMTALSQCVSMIRVHTPWLYIEWEDTVGKFLDKIPRKGVVTQTSLFHTIDKKTQDIQDKAFRYSFLRLGSLLALHQKWGEALQYQTRSRILVSTNVKIYEQLCVKLMSTPPDKVSLSFFGKEVPYWCLRSVENVIQEEKWDLEASTVLSMLQHQGLLLPVPAHLVGENSNEGKYFIRVEDIPEDHDILYLSLLSYHAFLQTFLWPEPQPKSRMLQNNRCYNILPSVPPGFMPKLLSTVLKVYEPLLIWKTGFYIRQGPVDVKACMYKYQGSDMDKTSVLVLSARVVDLSMDTRFRSSSFNRKQFTNDVRSVMFSCLQQVMAVVDHTCQKTEVYPCITLPCPECASSSTENMIDLNITWHLPYYIALASKHRCCKKHKRVDCGYLCDLKEEFGEGMIVPLHNYPYHLASSSVVTERVKALRHRPLDPAESCFYCRRANDLLCLHCSMCSRCNRQFAKMAKFLHPGHLNYGSFKLHLYKDGALTDDDRIRRNTRGSVFYYKKGHRMQFLLVMSPFYWDEMVINVIRGANYFIQMTFDSGKTLEYHSMTGIFINQNNESNQHDMWKSRDGNTMRIRLEAVEVGKRVRLAIQLRGLEILSEEVDGWTMKVNIQSEKGGTYIIYTPGMKRSWHYPEQAFKVGSTLEVAEDNHIHPAVVLEVSPAGYLLLDINGVKENHIFTSPQLMPSGSAEAMGSTLASSLTNASKELKGANGATANLVPVPLWSFLPSQVPCGYEKVMKNMYPPVSNTPNTSMDSQIVSNNDQRYLIMPCTSKDFPSVCFAKQVQLRDKVESVLFCEGKWNFSLTPFLVLPSQLTLKDFVACSQNIFCHKFKLHPLCYFRADVSTVMTTLPSVPEMSALECFHTVHMLDNEGVEFRSLEQEEETGLPLLWAWTLMLLRLQHGRIPQFTTLTQRVEGAESLTPDKVYSALWKIIQQMNHALFLSLGLQFDFENIVNDAIVQRWRELMSKHSHDQGLVSTNLAFSDEIVMMCETHRSTWQINKSLEHFSGLPGMYSQFVSSINLSNNSLTELSPQIFADLPNLKDLTVSTNLLVTLPEELSKCSKLMSLSLGGNMLTTLPEGLSQCQDLKRLDIDKNDFPEFPSVILQLKKLQRLYAQHLQLRRLPDNIGDLENLNTLSLSGNCFTELPDSFARLQKLTRLSLNGVVWAKVKNNAVLSKEHFEEDFLRPNGLHRWLKRHNQDKASIFRLFDEDTNGTLDPKEIGKLNATMFHVFHRFGYKGQEPPDDETPSGFPEVIFKLRNLEYLSLQYQGLVSIPDGICELSKLHSLHLANNPNLLSVSSQAGALPLKRLELDGCPLLKTPPKEIRAKGFVTTVAYLKRLLSGSVTCKRTKLMLVGLGGAGKTSLVKALLSGQNRTDLTIGEAITDGIDICPWAVPTEEGDVIFSVWDFAGQTVYYNTHQFFLTDRAVYLLMWNIRLGHEHAGLDFWLNSISVHAPKAPILVVGTHLDQVSKVEIPMKEMQAKFPQISGFHFVSSHTGQGVSLLKEAMVEVTLEQQYMGEKIPGVWLNFEESLKKIQDRNVIEFKELEARASRSGIFDMSELKQAVQFLHELGSLQHFTNANLKSHVVINPQWIVDVMACVVSVKDSHIKDGRLNHSDIGEVWKDYDPSLHQWMLKLTEEFDLTFQLKDQTVNLVPCLLSEKNPEYDWPEPDKNGICRETKIVYEFDYFPAGLFNRGQVRLQKFSDSSLIWKRGSYLKKNGHVSLIHQSQGSKLTVKAFGPRPENIVFLVHEMFETLILESFQGIAYDFFLPCPDCMKLVVKEPHMFAASVIRRATEMRAPFLQCLKYFHTISITDLHAIMPPDSNLDFDLHLVQAVQGMKEMQENMVADIFVSYCSKDCVVIDDETVLPTRVVADLEKLGNKCWMSRHINMQSTDEMAKALLDAKVFLVFMSNNYVKDETCCNLFKYARLTLRKPLVLVAIGPNLDWKKSNMGILMADEVFVNLMKASRYNHKFEELETILKDRYSLNKRSKKQKSSPPCFISYCWQNSSQAVAKGSRSTDGAVGFGDPRTIKDFLDSKGIRCWIDVERVGVHGLFEDIGAGLLNSKVVVVCMSDEYAASSNCIIEFRYALKTLKLPIVLAVVGTGNKWRAMEAGIMSLSCPVVSFQESNDSALDRLLEVVRCYIPVAQNNQEGEEKPSAEKEELNKHSKEQQRLSFQELCELAQRKFLRQVNQYVDVMDSNPYPNILLVDFYAEEKGQIETPEILLKEEDSTVASASIDISTVTPATSLKTEKKPIQNVETGDFHEQSFCVHLLCEHEEGWHSSGQPIPMDKNFGHILEQYLAYIARITAIAKYSTKLVLRCLASDVGRAYLRWLEMNPNVTVTTDFQESYSALRQVVQAADTTMSKGGLERCLMPSGKYAWLCKTHRHVQGVTILTRESMSSIHYVSETLGVDYMLLALRELDLNFLPQQLKEAQLALQAESRKKKSPKSRLSSVTASPGLEKPSATPEMVQAETLPSSSQPSISDVLSEGNNEQSNMPQTPQRPTLSRTKTKSKACLLM